jgi:DNA-directed RNA polymerase I, II, and III subunit RPABC5
MSLIPIRCFTCSNVLGNKYRFYQNEVRRKKIASGIDVDSVIYLNPKKIEKTPEAIVLDELNIRNVCCRKQMLCHVDII